MTNGLSSVFVFWAKKKHFELPEVVENVRSKKIWKKPQKTNICLPIDPPLEDIRTKVVESGQKRWIKTPAVNGQLCILSNSDIKIRHKKHRLTFPCAFLIRNNGITFSNRLHLLVELRMTTRKCSTYLLF